MRAGEQIVLATHSDRAELSLCAAVVQEHAPVLKETRQRRPVIEYIARRFGKFTARGFVQQRSGQRVLEFVEDAE